jgi:hypothetical protein
MAKPQSRESFSLRTLIRFLAGGKSPRFSRRHERFPCVMLGDMQVVEIDAWLDGVVVELSQGGCAFRPASLYLLDRTDEVVTIRTPDFEAAGRIRGVRPDSYGIQFFEDLDRALVDKMVAAHGGRIADSFLATGPESGMALHA